VIAELECAEAVRDPAQTFARRMRIARMRVRRAHNLAEQGERWVGQIISAENGVEGDILALVTKLTVRHVEHNPVVDLRPVGVVWKKNKFRPRIDELPNQPWTRHAVDFDLFPRDPLHSVSRRELEIRSNPGGARFFVNRHRRNRVFDRHAGAVEDNDFIFICAPGFAACDDFG
jgi:hypothetical protein